MILIKSAKPQLNLQPKAFVYYIFEYETKRNFLPIKIRDVLIPPGLLGRGGKFVSNFNLKLKAKSEIYTHYGTQSHDETASIALKTADG